MAATPPPPSAAARPGLGPQATGLIEGTVVDPAGTRVSDVDVCTAHGPCTVSAADGRFRLEKLPAGRQLLLATSPDAAAPPVEVFVSEREHAHVLLHLRAGASLTVEVTDRQTGAPVAGAEGYVTITRYGTPLRIDARGPADERGHLRFPAFPLEAVSLSVEAPGYVTAGELLTGIGQHGPHWQERVVLERGDLVTGVVVDESGAPVAEVALTWTTAWGPSAPWAPARTGPDGMFQVTAPLQGIRELRAEHPDHASTLHLVDPERTTEPLRIVLQAGRVVTGRVVDPRGRPVSGAMVSTGAPGSLPGRQTVSDEAGAFVLRGLPPPHVPLRLYAESESARSPPTSVPEAADAPVTLQLVHAAAAAGRVIHPDGRPAAQAAVRFQGRLPADPERSEPLPSNEAESFWIAGETLTDGDGRFEIRGLAPGAYRAMIVAGPDGPSAGPAPLRAHETLYAGKQDHRIVLPAPATLVGRVVTADDRPIESFRVALAGGSGLTAFHGRDGSFRFGPLSPGPTAIEIQADGFVRAEVVVETQPGQDGDAGEIVLARGHMLRGRVVDPAGRGERRAHLVLQGHERPVYPDATGAFAVTVPSLPVSVQAVGAGVGVSRVHMITSTSDALELRVPETGRLEVRLEEALDVDALTLRAVDPAPGAFHLLALARLPGESPLFAGDLPPGTYRLQLDHQPFATDASDLGTVTVEVDRVARVVIPTASGTTPEGGR